MTLAPSAGVAAKLCDSPLAGTYRTPQGALIALNPVAKTGGFRWTHEDGRTGLLIEGEKGEAVSKSGWSDLPGADALDLMDCSGRAVRLNGETAQRVPLIVEDVSFESAGATLQGRLIRPAGSTSSTPLVVDLQGSGRGSYLESNQRQYLLPAQGVAVFNFDKRGTGKSTGTYTQDFHRLAADAVQGMHAAKKAMGRHGRTGFIGSSQGGWVAPLAAKLSPVDFVVVNYGLAYSALREDREQVLGGLRRAGWNDASTIQKAEEVIKVAAEVVTEQTDASMLRIEGLRERYGDEPWWKDLGGEFTFFIAQTPKDKLARIAPTMDVGTSWTYDPLQTLRTLKANQLWLVPEADIEAPPEETLRRLEMLIREGRPVTLVKFPQSDHGIKLFKEQGRERVATRYAPGSQRIIADWIKGVRIEARGDEDFTVSAPRH